MPLAIITILAFFMLLAPAYGEPNDDAARDAARKQQQQREKETPRWKCLW
jgi:hypothetical protein